MGGGSSILSPEQRQKITKCRNFLLIRAYNLRNKTDETFQQQFTFLKKGDDLLDFEQFCQYMSLKGPKKQTVAEIFQPSKDNKISYSGLLLFFQQKDFLSDDTSLPSITGRVDSNVLPPPSPSRAPCRPRSQSMPMILSQELINKENQHITEEGRPERVMNGIWKKKEITVQEKITEYTKIDNNGQSQQLIEKEKHQIEILHMETPEGEFAHREITQFEQSEELNNEIISENSGKEEFLHLKSDIDEFTHFESSLPTKTEECEDRPPSPYLKEKQREQQYERTTGEEEQQEEQEAQEKLQAEQARYDDITSELTEEEQKQYRHMQARVDEDGGQKGEQQQQDFCYSSYPLDPEYVEKYHERCMATSWEEENNAVAPEEPTFESDETSESFPSEEL